MKILFSGLVFILCIAGVYIFSVGTKPSSNLRQTVVQPEKQVKSDYVVSEERELVGADDVADELTHHTASVSDGLGNAVDMDRESELMESRVLDCLDDSTLQFKKTPECNDVINDVFVQASTTKVFEEFEFALHTLYTEISFYELHQLLSDFLARAGIDRDSMESFWLSQAAYGGRRDKESVDEYYKNFNALSVENRQSALRAGVLIVTVNLLQLQSTHFHVLEEAQTIVESIPVDRFGIPSGILYLELVQLQSAMNLQTAEDYLLQTVNESDHGARRAAQALAEVYVHCDNEPVLCEIVGGSKEQLKEIIRANLDSSLFSEEERSQMKTLLDEI